MSASLKDLPFTDLYLRQLSTDGAEQLVAKFRPRGAGRGVAKLLTADEELMPELQRLFTMLPTFARGRSEFAAIWEGMRLRVTINPDVVYGQSYHLRRPSDHIPSLDSLGAHANQISVLQALGKTSGLVLVVGGIGDGKTTTASAMVRSWQEQYGGYAMVIEDVEELPLAGDGDGWQCVEVLVDGDNGWDGALRRALRSRPQYVLVSEIRSPAAAAQVLRMSIANQLVVTTLHASSIPDGLEALYQLAARHDGEKALHVLADGINSVIHQSLGPNYLDMTILAVPPKAGDAARAQIRQGQFAALNTIVERQHASLVGSAAWTS